MRITLIRHGQSESNKSRTIAGSSEAKLSKEGIEELHKLKKEINYPKADIYISSPLSRAVDTFHILYNGEKLHRKEESFKELYFGKIEGRPYEESNLDAFYENFLNNKNCEGGENFDDFYKRVSEGLVNLIAEAKENNLNSAVIVAHSIVIKSIVLMACNMKKEEFKNITLKNGYGYIVDTEIVDGEIVFSSCVEI